MGRVFLLAFMLAVGAAASAGSLYIPNADGATATNGTVHEFDSMTGQFKRRLFKPLAPDIISGMTLGPDRKLYLSVVDTVNNTNGRVLVFTLQGTGKRTVIKPGTGGLEFPNGLRFGPGGLLFVTSNSPVTDKILKFTTAGQAKGTVGTNLVTPQDLIFAPDGALLVSNGNSFASSVYRFDPVGNLFLGALVPTSAGGLQNPIGMAYGPDRNLYVVSFPRNAVLRFDGRTGAFIDQFASLDGLGLDTPTDLVFGPDGHLYVIARSDSTPGSAVVRFDGGSGEFIDVFVPVGTGGLGTSNTGMLFVDPGCARYGDYGFGNRCFPGKPQ